MEQRFPVENGRMVCKEAGDRVEVTMEVTGPNRGLYRGFLLGPGGRRWDLGTLLPERGCLCLHRSLLIENLRRQGCWPIVGGQVKLSYAFSGGTRREAAPKGWKTIQNPGELFPEDEILREESRGSGPAFLCRREDGSFCLAYPWNPGAPFPLPAAFCFAGITTFGGRPHVVFRFRADGQPELPVGAQEMPLSDREICDTIPQTKR